MVQKAYKFRFYPTPEQEILLLRILGCIHLIYNKALATRTQAWHEHPERVSYKQTSAILTSWKKQEYLSFLPEVSSVVLQQSLRYLKTASNNLFSGHTKYPNSKKKRNVGSATFTKSAFKCKDGQVYLAKYAEQLYIRWSRQLLLGCIPSTIAISDANWGELVKQLEYKAQWYSRTLIKIDRYFPSSKRYSNCIHIVEKLSLNIRQWDCPESASHHDSYLNASINILATGQAVLVWVATVRPEESKSRRASTMKQKALNIDELGIFRKCLVG